MGQAHFPRGPDGRRLAGTGARGVSPEVAVAPVGFGVYLGQVGPDTHLGDLCRPCARAEGSGA